MVNKLSLNLFRGVVVIVALATLVVFASDLAQAEPAETKVKVEVPPVISITATPLVEMQILPTPEGKFIKRAANVSVSTNNMTGYQLLVSDKDADTSMVHSAPTLADKITSLSGSGVVESAFPMNKWGLSLDNTNFQAVPKVDAALTIPGTANVPVSLETKAVHFGAKIDTNIASGTYADTLTFTAVANYVPNPTFGGITKMQEMTSTICQAETTPSKTATNTTTEHSDDTSLVPETTLTDTRDNTSYIVRKLADGNCWMAQNLALSPDGNTTYTNQNTDLNSKASWKAPAASNDGDNWKSNGSDGAHWLAPKPAFAFMQNGITPASTGQPLERTGNYYDWPMATAMSGQSLTNDGDEAPDSICPKGWRLPPYSGAKSYYNLLDSTYGIDTNSGVQLVVFPFNLLRAGDYYCNGYFVSQGQNGELWSSTASDDSEAAHSLYFDAEDGYDNGAWNRGRAFSSRCVAR